MNILCQTILKANSFIQKTSIKGITCRTYSLFEARPSPFQSLFLSLKSPLVEQICGFKVKLKLQKRCKDCYIVVRDSRKYLICPTHPRHKQMSMVKKPKYTWILTHASQSKTRPW
ncbi:mitochondrial ribosomal protein L36 [Rhodnius prolixus]|uniref:Large ribosomal subunit protein bL36m n=2 Tax=Rhodnius TaxID=13248 RepID=A0A4P6D7H7_RHOPR